MGMSCFLGHAQKDIPILQFPAYAFCGYFLYFRPRELGLYLRGMVVLFTPKMTKTG